VGENITYRVLSTPPCTATLRVASNQLVEFRLCGPLPHDEATFMLIADSLTALNPSKDIEPDSAEDALTMTFRAIRDQLSEADRDAFVEEQRAWIRTKEDACFPHVVLSEGFFQCLDMQVASRLALLRARVAGERSAGTALEQPNAMHVLLPAASPAAATAPTAAGSLVASRSDAWCLVDPEATKRICSFVSYEACASAKVSPGYRCVSN